MLELGIWSFLTHILRFKHRAEVVLAEQFAEFRDAALFVRAEMEMDVPAEVILAGNPRSYAA